MFKSSEKSSKEDREGIKKGGRGKDSVAYALVDILEIQSLTKAS